jgi:two-component system, NarL family, nitrate/nitrite response regulator NarL
MPRSLGLTRIVIVEDHALFAEVLDVALTLEGHDVHQVPVAERAATPREVLTACLGLRPRVVLLDLDLGATDGAALVKPLSRAGIAVVVVTGSIDRTRWGECLCLGARTVLPKSTPLNTILATIRLIGDGRPVLAREERDRLVACFTEDRRRVRDIRTRLGTLTMREREVLGQLTEGRTVSEIAQESYVSEATVRTQVKSILGKLEVSSQLAAVGAALRAQWHPPLVREQVERPTGTGDPRPARREGRARHRSRAASLTARR